MLKPGGQRQQEGKNAEIAFTLIMVSKGMVSKSKYSISEKNKGMPVSVCPYF